MNLQQFTDDMPIEKVEVLSLRVRNALADGAYTTVGKCRRVTDRELMRLPRFARKSLHELRSVAPYWVEPFTVSPPEQDIAIKARSDGSYAIAWALLQLTAVLRTGP
jgi:hypothetical protein